MRDFGIIVRLAWRNVWRNRRRTVLTMLTIVVGCAVIILMNAIAKGGHDRMIEDSVALNMGHIQVHEKGYWDARTIDYAFRPGDVDPERLRRDRRISGMSFRVHADGLLALRDTTAGAMIQGVDPEQEPRVSTIHTRILPGGRYLNAADRTSAVLGEVLAKNLGASVGSTISVISQGFDGSIAAEKLTVVGLFRTGNPEYDQALLVMPLAQAEETFYMMGYVHTLAIRLADSSDAGHVMEDIKKSAGPQALEVMGWDTLMPELMQFIVMDDIQAYIFDFILLMVVAFGILNTIQMAVFERTREFGVMLSIGTRPGQVVWMVLMESFFISLLGILLGLAAGYALSFYFQVHPMDYSEYAEEISVWGVSTAVFPADATALNLAVTAALTLAASMLFSLFPARRASKLNPMEAIRHL